MEVAISELDAKFTNSKTTCTELFVGEALQKDYASYTQNLEGAHRNYKDLLTGVASRIKGLQPDVERAVFAQPAKSASAN